MLIEFIEMARRSHGRHIHGEIGVDHLAFDRLFQFLPFAQDGMEEEVVAFAIKRQEEGNALDVVPMKMCQENVAMNRALAEFA